MNPSSHPSDDTLLRFRFETLEPAAHADVAAHLAGCDDCAARLARFGAGLETMRSAYDAEAELDPAIAASTFAKAKVASDAQRARERLTFLAWLGFAPGAAFRTVRRNAALVFLGAAALLGAGELSVATREVRTSTEVEGEARLLANARAFPIVRVRDPRKHEGVEGARVAVRLLNGAQVLATFEGVTGPSGEAVAPLDVPDVEAPTALLEVTTFARGEEDVARQPIAIGHDTKVHLSTDKPLYQPGQAIHVRALALDSPSLNAAAQRALSFEVLDPKGTRLAAKTVTTSRFGIAAWDVELASELALGDYQVVAAIGGSRTETSVKVSRYTLPKFKLTAKGARDTALAGETMPVDVHAVYFFGKPVAGAHVHATLLRADGTVAGTAVDGVTDAKGDLRLDLDLPASLASPGVPEAVELVLEAKDAAGEEEKKSQRLVVAREPLLIQVVPDLGGVAEALPNTLYLLTTTPDGRPVAATVQVSPSAGPDQTVQTGANGVGVVTLPPMADVSRLSVALQAEGTDGQRTTRTVALSRRDARFQASTDRVLYLPGDAITVTAEARGGGPAPNVAVKVLKEGRLVFADQVANGAALKLPAVLRGALELELTLAGTSDSVVRRIVVADAGGLQVSMTKDRDSHRPGETARLKFEVKDAQGRPKAAALGLTVVDESLWSLTSGAPAEARAFFLLGKGLRAAGASLLAGQRFTEEDQRAARVRVAGAAATERPGRFEARTLADEQRVLNERAATWNGFAGKAWWVLGVVFALLAAVALVRFAASWALAIGFVAGTFFLLTQVPYRLANDLLWLSLALYVLAAVVQSVRRGSFDWAFPLVAIGFIGFVTLFGDNIRRLFAMSADSLAGNDNVAMAMRAPSKRLMNFGADPEEQTEGMAQTPEAAEPPRRDVKVRQHFPETMFVMPELVTDEAGVATLDLPLADSITDWRLSALASSVDGQLGSMDAPVRAFQDFFVDLDTPVALVKGDTAELSIAVHNYLSAPQTVRLTVKEEPWFQVVGTKTFALKLAANEVGGQTLKVKVLKAGQHALTVQADGTSLSDAVARPVLVSEAGQQKTVAVSGTLKANAATTVALTIPEGAVAGSASLMLKVFPSHVASALEGLEGSLAAPHGCFEQTSSTTYPNVLIWDALQRKSGDTQAAQARAKAFVALGYQRLLTFEVQGGGFEWFGRAPANRVLTAYGLMEFRDMSRVFPVDEKLIERTQRWLLSQQLPDGTFPPDAQSLSDGLWRSGFDGRLMVTAYVTWALVSSGAKDSGVDRAVAWLAENGSAGSDAYTTALVTASLAATSHARTKEYVQKLVALAKHDEKQAWFTPSQATVYYSRGDGAAVEATALAALALVQAKAEPALVAMLLEYLAAHRDSSGGWHSTQGTVLALRALLSSSQLDMKAAQLSVKVNGVEAGTVDVNPAALAAQTVDLGGHAKAGLNTIEVSGASDAQFQAVAVYTQAWREKGGAADEPLALKVAYGRTKLQVGAVLPVDVQVTYRGDEASGMVVVGVGVPAGLTVLPDDLAELVATKAIAKFELGGGVVNLYLDALVKGAPRSLSLRLKAVSRVDTAGAGSVSFLYYHPALRAVAAAVPVEIR